MRSTQVKLKRALMFLTLLTKRGIVGGLVAGLEGRSWISEKDTLAFLEGNI